MRKIITGSAKQKFTSETAISNVVSTLACMYNDGTMLSKFLTSTISEAISDN